MTKVEKSNNQKVEDEKIEDQKFSIILKTVGLPIIQWTMFMEDLVLYIIGV